MSIWPKSFVPACAALLLAGCFPPMLTSRSVTIPEAERSLDPGLAGTYWHPEATDAAADFGTVTITSDAARFYHFVYRNKSGDDETSDELGAAVLLQTTRPEAEVLIYNAEGKSDYMLLVRSRAGSLVLFPFLGETETAVGKGREAVLAAVAERHGLRFHSDEAADELVLDGPLDRARIVALFSDPDFLGALRLDPDQGLRLFPADRPLPPLDDRSAWWPDVWSQQLSSPRFALDRNLLVRPPRLLGRFNDSVKDLTISEAADGCLVMTYVNLPGPYERPPARLCLLSIGEEERYLALLESRQSPAPGETDPSVKFDYYLVRLSDPDAIDFVPLRLVGHDFSPAFDGFVRDLRQKAAARHGLAFSSEGRLEGNLGAGSVCGLLLDPWFQATLDAQDETPWITLRQIRNSRGSH